MDQLQSMLDFETADRNGMNEKVDSPTSILIYMNSIGSRYIPPSRLLTLLRQAVAYQIEFSRYHPKVAPAVHSYVALHCPSVSCAD